MNKFIKSPLNYIGGKYGLLNDIFKEFPQNIDNFFDMFAGGLNVGINVEANNIYVNDQITYLIEMYDYFQKTDIELLVKSIEKIIVDYNLSKDNTTGYNKLREDYNNNPTPLILFILTCFSFNHQIRFNNSHNFNTPFGKSRSSYNESIKRNLMNFCTRLQKGNYILMSKDFRMIDYSFLKKGDVVYCDPPYLITTGSYNDGKRGFSDWTDVEDNALFNLLDEFNDRGIYFFLSNVFHHKGLTNSELIDWSKKYRVIYLDKDYSNSNYHSKNTDEKTVEVIVTNYCEKMENRNTEERAIPFLEAYPEYDLFNLPFWVRENIELAVVTGKKYRSILMPDGRRYNMDNKLNHLSGQEWTYFINSVFSTRYATNGKESYAHRIRKIHPTPKPPQLMRDIILFFTKENEIVFDSFMGVGGTLIGAALCRRRAIGIDLNAKYIEAYKNAVAELGLPQFPTYEGDCISLFKKEKFMVEILKKEKISLLLIDPPYANMMSKQKTGADIEVYGKVSTPFTNSELDLGNKEINDFLKLLKESIELVIDHIKNHGHIVIFIKDLQPKNGSLNMLHYDVAQIVNTIEGVNYKGMRIWNDETAKLYPYGYPFSFVANQTHQYILIFRKEK